jgi:anti-anti-sigma factor
MTPPTIKKKFSIRSERTGMGFLIHVAGTLDLYTMNEFKKETDLLQIRKGDRVILDISGLMHMDSAGIGSILRFLSAVRGPQAKLFLTTPSPMLIQVFKATGLDKFFTFIP